MAQKILILNWRDPLSPLEGGAERFTLKYAEYWKKNGARVWWLTNSFEGSEDVVTRNGVKYIRVGPSLTGSLVSYLFFYPQYIFKSILTARRLMQQEQFDVVIDEIHGLPFFAPLYMKTRVVLLVCEVAGTIWDKMFPFPINIVGKTLERLVYALYRKNEIWAISDNTRQNIQELLPGKEVGVIDLGIEYDSSVATARKSAQKTEHPSAVFLARLVPMKGIEAALEAVSEVVLQHPDFQLVVIGRGMPTYETYLRDLVRELKIQNNVTFTGHLEGDDKYMALASAWYLLHPSYKEGFGLTLIEAGIVGTPAIIRSGSSMDALISDGENGYTFQEDSNIPETLKSALNTPHYKRLAATAQKRAMYYTWESVLKRSRKVTQI